MYSLPETGFLRLPQIIGQRPIARDEAEHNRAAGRPNRCPRAGITPIIPVSATTWWAGVKTGLYPAPVKLGGSTVWRVEDVRALIVKLGQSLEASK